MAENLFEVQYDVTKKSKLKRFYESNKVFIFSFIFILIIFFGSFSFYQTFFTSVKYFPIW